jgi:signal transduction histidine kinase
MEIIGKDTFEKLRVNTDKSLEDERGKTDDYLAQKSKIVTKEAEEAIRLDRRTADEKRDLTRSQVDHDKAEGHLNSSPVEDRNLIDERERSDRARKLEREKEDQIRTKERIQKRLIAEVLLQSEREETDNNLLDERASIDLESDQISALLTDEKNSHDLTKTALISRDQFLAVVSHDLRNPLWSISMSAGKLRDYFSDTAGDIAAPLKFLNIIERNAANMDRMISDLLDIERMANAKLILKPSSCDIVGLFRECKGLFAPLILNKSFSMTIETSAEQLSANVDHDRILQVLSNLISNALKFAPNGGSITLSAEKMTNEIAVSVTDNGPGIPEAKIHQIFERFSQLGSNDRRGLGLGLFISKWIVEAHKGRIWVTSQMGKGSTFTFTLPLSLSQ